MQDHANMATPPNPFIFDHQKTAATITAEYGDPLDDLQWVSEARARDLPLFIEAWAPW